MIRDEKSSKKFLFIWTCSYILVYFLILIGRATDMMTKTSASFAIMIYSVVSCSYCIHRLRSIAERVEKLLRRLSNKNINIMDDIIGNVVLARMMKNIVKSDDLEREYNQLIAWRVGFFFTFAFVGISIVVTFLL